MMTRPVIRAMALLVLASVLGACASDGPTVPAAQCPSPVEGSSEYFIGPGDMLQIVAWRNEELSATVPVRPDGRISTPLVDDMVAAGKSPSRLAADMESVLAEYVRTPEISVIVTAQGAANQVQIVGEVAAPQSLSFREGLRILDAIVAVGGLTDFAAGNRTKLVRETQRGQAQCRVLVKDLLGGDMTQNILIYPGDVISLV